MCASDKMCASAPNSQHWNHISSSCGDYEEYYQYHQYFNGFYPGQQYFDNNVTKKGKTQFDH